ncbi:roadblock/LC7 domain-containing protein [Kitasatospora sp. NPDC049285]|uniref:roadblock/LC7 domain-containing protein n=1 Tax=Kitasatospora sp. NPDC049285 TaxID=3157096 RepID=UPI0034220E85
MPREALRTELQLLRHALPGVTDSAIAAVDGFVVAADTGPDAEPALLSAMAAATLSLARRTAEVTGRGELGHVLTDCADGRLVVYAIQSTALLLVVGDRRLDLDRLNRQAAITVNRVGAQMRGQVHGFATDSTATTDPKGSPVR